MRRTKNSDLTGQTFGMLTVAHSEGAGDWFCCCAGEFCDGTGTRIASRAQLIRKQVESCRTCSAANKYRPNGPMVVHPVIEPVKVEIPKCTGYVKQGYRYCEPDCPLHSPFRIDDVRTARKPSPIPTGFV